MKLRRLAKGKPCQVRIPGICNGDMSTTVLAHYRLAGLCGMGQKPDDLFGAWACNACHDVTDQRRKKVPFDYTEIRLMHAEGIFRTLAELKKLGHIA